MMKDNGGPAFPLEKAIAVDGTEYYPAEHTGMSLRDYFAACALTNFKELANPNSFAVNTRFTATDVVAFCYDVADAMLAERSKNDETK